MAAGARKSSAGAAVLAVLALVLVGRKSKAAEATMNLTGTKVDAQHSWSGSVKDWATSRFGAALAAVKAHWAGTLDEQAARDVALSLLTHWGIETADGAAEWNWNVGNITAVGAQDFYLLKDISGIVMAFRSFDSLSSGVNAYVELLASPRYAPAAKKLADNPTEPDWYVTLGKCGWFDPTKAKPPSTWDHAAADFAARRALLAQYATGGASS